MDILFYDGQCPLCRKEIETLKRLEQGNLGFVDIHHQPDDGPLAPGREALLRRLHLVTSEGQWFTGLEATVRAWSHTSMGWLFRPLSWPLIRPLSRHIYEGWADRRYERRYACGRCITEVNETVKTEQSGL
ncbi:thiol-disulfide oxidoreductase DCC family protein [Marinobacter sp.]|uniref:thiol-disulfide oxidoreductase DCC family protein n=1 Tax=Marinobacter sp. TaxID=50741 RepID=UPI00356758DA